MKTSRLRRRTLTAAALIAVLGAGACGEKTKGQPVGPDTGSVAGLEITHFESGFKPDAPQPQIQVDNATDSQEDKVAVATIADVTDFWTEVMPADFGMEFQQLRKLLSYDSNTDDFQLCGESVKGLLNAFYCPPEDTIAWDRGGLLPRLTNLYGDVSTITVLAHEYGHAVQHRLGAKAGIDPNGPEPKTIVLEQQADCFTGSYFRWIVDGKSKYFQVSTAEGLNAALSTMYLVRDAPGRLHGDVGAHGTSFDRTLAFHEGFTEGATKCATYNEQLIRDRSTQFKKNNPNAEGDVPVDEKYLGLVRETLDQVFQGKGKPEVATTSGSCPDGTGTPPTSYCPNENLVAVDLATLNQLGSPLEHELETGQASKGKGDFAAFASFASRYVLAVQKAEGKAIDTPMAALRTACLTGAWAKLVQKPPGEQGVERPIELAPGDVDEAVLEMLQPRSLIGSNVKGEQVESGFLRVDAFRDGYLKGVENCGTEYP